MTSAAKPAPGIGPDLRSALIAMVRKRVPESEVEDIVQTALAEAIESPHAPSDSESLRRWIFGVAKNKVVDYHRRAGRESFDMPELADDPAPHAEADLLRWAERHLPDGVENQKTLDWMIREGEGEKLESIAESEKLPPPRVRQRVSRLRRHFKENWQKEVALLAALGVIISAIAIYLRQTKHEPDVITHEVVDPRAEPVRRAALESCAANDWKRCVDGLDEAKRLDPAGDTAPVVQKARQAADNALKTAPPPTAEPTALPTTPPPEVQKDMKTAPAKPQSSGFTTPVPTAESTAPVPAPKTKGKPGPSKAATSDFDSDPSQDFGGSIKGGGGTTAPAGSKKKSAPPSSTNASGGSM